MPAPTTQSIAVENPLSPVAVVVAWSMRSQSVAPPAAPAAPAVRPVRTDAPMVRISSATLASSTTTSPVAAAAPTAMARPHARSRTTSTPSTTSSVTAQYTSASVRSTAAPPNNAPPQERSAPAHAPARDVDEPHDRPQHRRQPERVLPERHRVERDRGQQAHCPERGPSRRRAAAPGERACGQRAEHAAEHREHEQRAIAAQLVQRIRRVQHRQRGDLQPRAVDVGGEPQGVQLAGRVARGRPVADIGIE